MGRCVAPGGFTPNLFLVAPDTLPEFRPPMPRLAKRGGFSMLPFVRPASVGSRMVRPCTGPRNLLPMSNSCLLHHRWSAAASARRRGGRCCWFRRLRARTGLAPHRLHHFGGHQLLIFFFCLAE